MSATVYLRFYEELNDYLPAERRKVTFEHSLESGATVRDTLRSVGVPVEAVDLALLNGRPAALDEPVSGGDRLAFYPVFESFDISGLQRLRPAPLRAPRFAVSREFRGLATWLRILGLEASVFRRPEDLEGRILVGTEAHAAPAATRFVRVRGRLPQLQAHRLLRRLQLLPRPLPPLRRRLRRSEGRRLTQIKEV
ncbi:MAG: hypothetical protein HY900_26675 [Deltaproteobacteria bacterium]|nr:hypothetical protein [Deltaproteobacteria bacterium]